MEKAAETWEKVWFNEQKSKLQWCGFVLAKQLELDAWEKIEINNYLNSLKKEKKLLSTL